MSDLIKLEPINLPNEVSSLSRSVFKANSSVMIKKITDKNIVVPSIHQSIHRAIADKGVTMTLDEVNYLKKNVTDDILKDFPTLTLEDIILCFSMGVRGNLGEYYGINVSTFYGWLKKYKENIIPKMVAEVKNFLPPPPQPVEFIDFKKFDLEKIDNIISAITLYASKKQYIFNDLGNIHYKFLDKLGYIDLDSYSDEENESLKQKAKNTYINKIKDDNLEKISRGRKFQTIDINELLNKIEDGDKDAEIMIEIIYKKLIIEKFITSVNECDIESLKNDLTKKVEESYEK